MKYYRLTCFPSPNGALRSQIASAAERLHQKLMNLDLKEIGISEYNQRYLGSRVGDARGFLGLYSYLLALCLQGDHARPLNELVFVDYGAGNGLLSFLAKELGIGRVVYNDIYDVSCQDASILAKNLGLDITDWVCGDIDELVGYINSHSISVNVVASYDVIEHIYDLEGYLAKLHQLSNGTLRLVLASSANIENPLIRRRLRRIHIEREYKGRERKWGHKERDSVKSFIGIRKEIIAGCAHGLDIGSIDEIAKSTRGLIKSDIEKCVDELSKNGKITYKPEDPTNTCDPLTGNWSERLICIQSLKASLENNGFKVKILPGFWLHSESIHKRLIKYVLNLGIKYLGRKGLFLSPYYVAYADYESSTHR